MGKTSKVIVLVIAACALSPLFGSEIVRLAILPYDPAAPITNQFSAYPPDGLENFYSPQIGIGMEERITVTWTTKTNKTYWLEGSTVVTFDDPNTFIRLSPRLPGTGTNMTHVFGSLGQSFFFRVVER